MAGEPIDLIDRAAFGLGNRALPPIPRRKPTPPLGGPVSGSPGGAPAINPLAVFGALTGGGAGGFIPSLTGGDAGPSRATAGDIFARTGSFNVGSGSATDGTSPSAGPFPNVGGNSLIVIVAIGAAAWIVATALRR